MADTHRAIQIYFCIQTITISIAITIVIIVIWISAGFQFGLFLLVLKGGALSVMLLFAGLLALPCARDIRLEAKGTGHTFELEEETARVAQDRGRIIRISSP